MFKQFSRYLSVGVLNTLLHWAVFSAVLTLTSASQAIANLIAFGVAVSFSFVVNARFTFKAQASTGRYVAFVGVMGALSVLTGWASDQLALPPLVTLVAFSIISLVCGFIYSKYVVFRESES
ncbi:MAG TPA: GtrA family protein [Burkholderiaceae bacterium]|nr:GtrA family protein [Burkholderiaceae bacterium]